MTYSFLKYPLSNGFIHHWLAAGPVPLPGCTAASLDEPDQTVLESLLSSGIGFSGDLVDLGQLTLNFDANPLPTWRYYRCRSDHYVDISVPDPLHRCQIGYCAVILRSPSEQEVTFSLSASGLADLWLDRQSLYRLGSVQQPSPQTVQVKAVLHTGRNEILIRLISSGAPLALQECALQVRGAHTSEIEIPTLIEPEDLPKRMALEEAAEAAFLGRYVYGYLDGDLYNRNEPIPLRFSTSLQTPAELTYRLQSLSGDIFQEGTHTFGPASTVEMARTYPLRSGPLHLALLPTVDLYYIKKVQFERKEPLFIVRAPYSTKVSPSFAEQIDEALKDAAERRGDHLFTEIARMALGRWDTIDRQVLQNALAQVEAGADSSVFDLLGLLGMLARFGKQHDFPKEIRSAIAHAAEVFTYTRPPEQREGDQIALCTCEILAGELLSKVVLGVSGKLWRDHRENGEQQAIEWMRARGKFGFHEWDSPDTFEAAVAALTHLVDLASSAAVRDLASVLLDKIFFRMAANSYNGAFASSRGASDTAAVFSARLASTSGMTRLLWTYGNFNDSVMGTVSLACCSGYHLPEIIARIATDNRPAVWSREQNSQPFEGDERPSTAWHVNKVSYRTADYILSSAQDYAPGQKGSREHIWQAALGPDAVVFTNHPINMSEEDNHAPNLWRGNGVLPRVAQWGDVLIAAYRLPEDDWLGFTHAYFPSAAFNETNFSNGWAFARSANGYLALTAFHPFEFITEGQTAYRELRSVGKQNLWLCHMGQKLLDGSFDAFQQKILATDLELKAQSARLQSLRGDTLEFGWTGPLLVNGVPQSLDGFPHIENAYCSAALPAAQIDIFDPQSGLRLKFD